MSDLLNQASLVMVPSGYKEDTVYSVVPSDGSGDLSFTRASNGTRVNSAGLVEVCPWNLVEQSEAFSNTAVWNVLNGASVTANTTTAPNGTTTADTLTFSTNVSSNVYAFCSAPVGANVVSVYAKVASGTKQFRLRVDLPGGTTSPNFTATTEWQRFEFAVTTTTANLVFYIINDSVGVAGDLYIWGAQLNIGSTAKPYFPTTDRLNVPRLTYQNGGGGCPSLLLEKQSTNLATQSTVTSFGSNIGDWLNGNNSPASINQTMGIDGTQNGTKYTKTAGVTSDDYFYKAGVAVTPLSTYTISGYIKLGTASNAVIVVNNSLAWDTIANGSFVCSSSNGFSTTAWKRFEITITAPLSGAINIHYGYHNETGVPAQATGTFFLDGLQVEPSSYATSLIPTTSSSATRVADACYKTGISSLIGQTEGTMFADVNWNVKAESGSPVVGILNLNNNVANLDNCIVLGIERQTGGGNRVYCFIINSGTGQADLFGSLISSGRYKIALGYKANDFVLYVNGVQIATDTSGTVPTTSEVLLGQRFQGDSVNLNDTINETILFKTRLTNTELASLTTL